VRISKSLLVHGIRYWHFLPAAEGFTQIAQSLANCNAFFVFSYCAAELREAATIGRRKRRGVGSTRKNGAPFDAPFSQTSSLQLRRRRSSL
jgi:hypothetical protein